MSLIKSIHPIIPIAEFAEDVSIDLTILSPQEVQDELEVNPLNYMHIIRSHLHFGTLERDPSKHFPLGREYFLQLLETKVIQKFKSKGYFFNRITSPAGVQYDCLIAGVTADDILDNKLKKHENTLVQKEDGLIDHLNIVGSMGQPILVTGESNSENDWKTMFLERGEKIFTFEDHGYRTEVYFLEDDDAELMEVVSTIKELYIADGHHRAKACSRYLSEGGNGNELVSIAFIEKEDLTIHPFHRAFKRMPFSTEEFVKRLSKIGQLEEVQNIFAPLEDGVLGIFTNDKRFKLILDKQSNLDSDVCICEDKIIKDIFGIEDSRKHKNIIFVDGRKPLELTVDLLNKRSAECLITLSVPSIEEIVHKADLGEMMPPKSTYILPKLRTGLFISQYF